jgi:8-oxo-dGTP pyrophosphatase MutT (NUDIX family)
MNIDPTIPYFEDKDNPIQADKQTVERRTINAIVYNPKTDSILCLDWKDHNWKTTIIGGIEDGEDLESAGRREVTEETGYLDLEYKGEVTKFYTSFYAAHKGVNRLADTTAVLFILESDSQKEINAEETKNHTFTWVSKDTVLDYLNVEPQIFAVKEALKIV